MAEVITRDDLKELIDAGEVTVVDALGGSHYKRQHLPGAITLVEAEVDALASALLPDKDAAIVIYCSNPACGNSQAVAALLEKAGYQNVRTYRDGIEDWVGAGLPVETG